MRLWIFNGLYGHDDWPYLYYLRSFLNGDNKELLNTLFGLRWGIWVPIAVLFRIFGVHYWLAFAPGFVMGLASIPLAYLVAFSVSRDSRLARWATLALAFNPIDWFVSTTIRGDIEMSFFGGLIALGLVLFESSRKTNPSRAVWLAIATGVSWGLAALTKEWAFIYGWGFLAVVLWNFFRERRIPWAYAYILLGFAAVMAVDGLFLYLTTGLFYQRFLVNIWACERIRLAGGFQYDLSLSYAYLPGLLLNLTNNCTLTGRFSNGYPLYGWYFYLFFGALGWGIWRLWTEKSLWASLLAFVMGTMLWMEFGSVSMVKYCLYHKEPRYLTIFSVPIACLIGWALSSLWSSSRPWARMLLAALLLSVAFNIGLVMHSEHVLYTESRDFLPKFIPWLKAHPEIRLWTSSSVQQDIDLRFGYRFADPVHQHRGQPGFGAIQDICFLSQAKPGDLILLTPFFRACCDSMYSQEKWYTPGKWQCIEEFNGRHTHTTLYRMSQ